MKSNNITSLSSDLIVKKGEALPTPAQNTEPSPAPIKQEGLTKRKSGTIAVTLRLDPERYEKLKLYGVYHRLTNQEIIVSALDAYLEEIASK